MNSDNKNRLEELKKQQLIDSILGRKQLEHDSLIKAAKMSVNNKSIDINKEKDRILAKNLEKQRVNNTTKMEALQRKIMEEEVDLELKKIEEEERIQAQRRAKQTDEILRQIDIAAKNRRRLERKDTEFFRRKQKKLENFVEQLKSLDKGKEEKRISSVNLQPIQALNKKSIDITSNKNMIRRPYKNRKIDFKLSTAIQRYTDTMEFYYENHQILQKARQRKKIINNSRSESSKRKSFIECLKSAIDHKKALENVKNKEQGKANIRPRIID